MSQKQNKKAFFRLNVVPCVLIQIKLLNVLYNCHIFGNKLEVTSINI